MPTQQPTRPRIAALPLPLLPLCLAALLSLLLQSSYLHCAAAAESLSVEMPCTFTSAGGVEFGNIGHLRQFYSDYTWSGWSSGDAPDQPASAWTVGVNVCKDSASSAACRSAAGAVCIYNQTSIDAHTPDQVWPTDLIVGGTVTGTPPPVWSLLDESNPRAGVQMVFRNSPADNPVTATIQLRCDTRFLTANVSAGAWSPQTRSLTIALAANDACPTFMPSAPFEWELWMILAIVAGGLIFLYICLGCVYNSQVRGTPHGWASCPHSNAWLAGPRAIGRGCAFAWHWTLNGCKMEAEVYTEL